MQLRPAPQRGRRARAALALVLALAACAALPSAHAKVTFTRLFRDDRSLIPVTPDYAFGSAGRIEIVLRNVTIWQRHVDEGDVKYDNFGFLLLPVVQQEDSTLQADLAAGKCLLRGREPQLLTFASKEAKALIEGKAGEAEFIVDVEDGGWGYLYFVNCEPGAAVSFKARIAMYNLRPDGGRDYLSIGETELDTVYWIMFALFGFLSVSWAALCAKRRDVAHRIHWLMLALVVCKALTLLGQALMTKHVEATGSPDGWNWFFYLFTTARGLLFFTVVVLLGAGWSYMKPFLDDNTRTVLLVVAPLQVFANVALIFVDEESPAMRDWLTWLDIFHMVDIVCCIIILAPIVQQIRHLRDAAGVDGKAARSLAKLRLFRNFYVTVVAYIYFTRIIVFLLKNTVPYSYAWVSEAASEAAALLFYTYVGASFAPHKENRYLKLEVDDVELAAR